MTMSCLAWLTIAVVSGVTLTVAADETDGTELLFTFVIHRHGDRTPIESQMIYSIDKTADEDLVAPYGYGQLNKAGIQTAYDIGKHLRVRYDSLIAPTYKYSEVYVYSTDIVRTKMTITTALAALYASTDGVCVQDQNRYPATFTVEPVLYATASGIYNCPTFSDYEDYLLNSANIPEMEQHSGVLRTLANDMGIDLTATPLKIFSFRDFYLSMQSLGKPFPETVQKNWDKITKAAETALKVIWNDEQFLSLQAGNILKDFYDSASAVISDQTTPRVRIYSTHDYNVYSLKGVCKVPLGIPAYGATFALELRKVTATGQYVVLAVDKATPEEPEQYVEVEGCDLLCDFDQFLSITSKYMMDVKNWRQACGWWEDMPMTTVY